jgi:hypothetical protein
MTPDSTGGYRGEPTSVDLAVAALGAGDDSAVDAVATGHRVLVDESGEW